MRPDADASTWAAIAAFALSIVVYATVASSLPFYDKGEPREALVVQGALRGDDIVLPRPDAQHLPSKPPLFHWLAAVAIAFAGRANEFAVRLPSVVLGALAVALTTLVAAHAYGVAAGCIAAVVLGSSFEWMRAATQSRVDMTLTFFVIVAIWAWHVGVAEPARRRTVRVGYLASGAAVLTKGPVGLALPILVLVADAFRRRDLRSLRRLVDVPGACGMLIVGAGWYALAWTRGGSAFVSRHFVHENVQRFVGWGSVAHRHPALYYFPALAVAFLPWTLALPTAAQRLWHRREGDDAFLLVWIVSIFGFYSLAAGKRSTYLLPIFPPLAILTGSALAASTERPPGTPARVVLLATSFTVLAGALLVGFDRIASLRPILDVLVAGTDRARLPAALDAVHADRGAVAVTLAIVAGALAVVALPNVGRTARLVALGATAFGATVGLTAFGTYPVASRLSTRPFADRVLAHLRPGDRLCTCGDLDGALRFYLGGNVVPCNLLGPPPADARTSAIEPPATNPHGARERYHVWALPASDFAGGRPCATHASHVMARAPAAESR
ncbi:MAG TPA: glycosyltransferase family 39 protein [Candidatus Eisenbacteria bacterium]|nr:glycosyltransferase family 39 protein [Candidatus Eisenbacteria bacterium]